ncbi:hypothetical protein [Mariprofundus sp. KV]|uniref:hypothetical protein n=1 Tax=Mariprofundus sp. KV TaxID=2608715 RepID=UPI0015A26D31|nr:hypothetical protein [Mariprofundus sp. KV]
MNRETQPQRLEDSVPLRAVFVRFIVSFGIMGGVAVRRCRNHELARGVGLSCSAVLLFELHDHLAAAS